MPSCLPLFLGSSKTRHKIRPIKIAAHSGHLCTWRPLSGAAGQPVDGVAVGVMDLFMCHLSFAGVAAKMEAHSAIFIRLMENGENTKAIQFSFNDQLW